MYVDVTARKEKFSVWKTPSSLQPYLSFVFQGDFDLFVFELVYWFVLLHGIIITGYVVSRRSVIVKACGRKWSWPLFRYCLKICLEGQRKENSKHLRQDSCSVDLIWNLGMPEHEVGVLTTTLRCSIYYLMSGKYLHLVGPSFWLNTVRHTSEFFWVF
jgi:hypothetical protein